MGKRTKVTKAEWALLGVTAVFLCGLLVLSGHDAQRAAVSEVVVSADVPVPDAVLTPEAEPLDLNRATVEELDALPGIGEVLAGRIVAYREENGPFESVEELMEVSGIGEAKLADLAGLVTVNGKDTA